MDSFELLKILKANYEIPSKTPYWWPNHGTFEVVVGAILVQRTKWENVDKSLKLLKSYDFIDVEKLASVDDVILQDMIKKCGFYYQKAKYLKLLCQNILKDFGDFDVFVSNVSREWLLNQKGIGFESADAILNFTCKKEVFVADSYLHKTLSHLGFCFDEYEQMQDWVVNGLDDRIYSLYPTSMSLAQIYARFHGKIVMFGKENIKGKNLSKKGAKLLGI